MAYTTSDVNVDSVMPWVPPSSLEVVLIGYD